MTRYPPSPPRTPAAATATHPPTAPDRVVPTLRASLGLGFRRRLLLALPCLALEGFADLGAELCPILICLLLVWVHFDVYELRQLESSEVSNLDPILHQCEAGAGAFEHLFI